MSAQLQAAEDRLAKLEAEAHLARSRIRDAADRGDIEATIALYQRLPVLRVELLAARHVVARLTRRETKQYGFNSALTAAEHLLDIELAALGVPDDAALRRVLG